MKINIQHPDFLLNETLNEYINSNVQKLSHFSNEIESASVYLKLEKSAVTETKVCEIRLSVPGNDLFATKVSNTFEEAISETVNALKQQVEKMKSKAANHT